MRRGCGYGSLGTGRIKPLTRAFRDGIVPLVKQKARRMTMLRITQQPHRGERFTWKARDANDALIHFEIMWNNAGGLEGVLADEGCYHFPEWDEDTDEIPDTVQLVSDEELLLIAVRHDMQWGMVLQEAD